MVINQIKTWPAQSIALKNQFSQLNALEHIESMSIGPKIQYKRGSQAVSLVNPYDDW